MNIKNIELVEFFEGEKYRVESKGRPKYYKSFESALKNADIINHAALVIAINQNYEPAEIEKCKVKDILKYSKNAHKRYLYFTEDKSEVFYVYLKFDDGSDFGINLEILNGSVPDSKIFKSYPCLLKSWKMICRNDEMPFNATNLEQLLNVSVLDQTIGPFIWFERTDTRVDFPIAYSDILPVGYDDYLYSITIEKEDGTIIDKSEVLANSDRIKQIKKMIPERYGPDAYYSIECISNYNASIWLQKTIRGW